MNLLVSNLIKVSFCLLFSSLTFAQVAPVAPVSPVAPAVVEVPASINDSVTYDGTLKTADGSLTVGFIQRRSITSFDSKALQFSVKTTLYLPDGSAKDQQDNVATSDLKSRALIKEILEKCQSLGGRREVISVVGGDFDTCAVQSDKGDKIWWGDVPFNVVKVVTTDENKDEITLEVSLFSFGK